MMKELKIIKKLREERQTRGEEHLRACKDQQNKALQALAEAERAERVENVLRRGREERLYAGVIARALTHDDLQQLRERLDQIQRDAEARAAQTHKAMQTVQDARNTVSKAQSELAQLYRSRLKWDELHDRAYKADLATREAAEEDALDEVLICQRPDHLPSTPA